MSRWIATLFLTISCMPTYGRGELDLESGYVADELPLSVSAEGLDALDARWLVKSHQPNGEPRVGRQFLEMRSIDWDDDGRRARYRAFDYHLQLGQRSGAGEIWLQSNIVEPTEQTRDLRVIADEVLGAIAEGQTQNVVTWSGHAGSRRPMLVQQVREPIRVEVLDRMDGQLKGQAAHLVIFDALREGSGARLALLFVRAPFYFSEERRLGRRRGWPVLLVAGYGNGQADFEAGLTDFDTFVQSIEMEPNAETLGLGQPD